jgi:DMSO reductase family type II enzyme heme b subunit
MKQKLSLIAAPTGMQPGGYVRATYTDRDGPRTPTASLEAERSSRGWRFRIAWPCPDPVRGTAGESDRFPDAAAIVVPSVPDAPWVTMGAPGQPVAGLLWRADREALLAVRAEGLGSVQRSTASDVRRVASDWSGGEWSLRFDLSGWSALDESRQLAIAIWRGAERERAGLKSISRGWIEVES